LTDFPSEARVAGTQFSYDGKGYILSGDGDDHEPLDFGEFWEYTPANDSWIQLPSHPGGAIWAPGSFIIGCDAYFLLGQDNNYNFPSLPVSLFKYKLDQSCGCMDSLAYNFSNISVTDDGSCCYISGCTDPLSYNFDPTACFDDGNCVSAVLGCMNPIASNYNSNANVTSFNGGALDNNIGSGAYFYNDQHLIFDSYDNCLIKSCDVYLENSTSLTFELRNNNGTVIDDTTIFVFSGKQNIILNFDVPISTNLQLGVSNNSGLYRNATGADFPYNIAGMINITGSSASNPLYYYFFYNIQVESICLNTTNINNIINPEKSVLRTTNVLGSVIKKQYNSLFFDFYNDGSVEKKIIIE